MKKNFQKGQILIVLLLVTLVALTVGLAIVQRSVTDISISTKTEQSTRALTAAEAGLEKALQDPYATNINVPLSGNQSEANVTPTENLPRPGQSLEYPKLSKADFSHFWLADPGNNLATFFDPDAQNSLMTVYFGNSTDSSVEPDYEPTDIPPAINVHIIAERGGQYISKRLFIDSVTTRNNSFIQATCPPSGYVTPIYTTLSSSISDGRYFRCKYDIDLDSPSVFNGPAKPILIRIRVLYANKSQPVAVGSCNSPAATAYNECDLPPQARILTSVGTSGQTQRKLQLFRLFSVVPFYFDYAIFSVADIEKQ